VIPELLECVRVLVLTSRSRVCGAEGQKRSVALTAVDMEGFKNLNIDSEANNVIFVIQVVSHPIALACVCVCVCVCECAP